jgi:hypothetical protein
MLLASSGLWITVQAYDQHLNMILGEVEETITTVEIDDETYEEIIKVRQPAPRYVSGESHCVHERIPSNYLGGCSCIADMSAQASIVAQQLSKDSS